METMSVVKSMIKRMLNQFGYEISRITGEQSVQHKGLPPQINVYDLIVQHELARSPDWFFIQIGAHDGCSLDPLNHYIKKHHWRGILVEPQPKVFSRLRKTYENEPQLILENAAIADRDGTATMYAFKEAPDMPYHATMLASFNRRWLETNSSNEYRGEIEELHVPAFCIKSLLEKHKVKHVNLLQIDTEGFDFQILRMVAEAGCWPSIIHFEDQGGTEIATQIPAWEQLLAPFIQRGYSFHHYCIDTIAFVQSDETGYRQRTQATRSDFASLQAPPLAG
jgi:FkbM family methyltransferase